jgi:hypothetical protein
LDLTVETAHKVELRFGASVGLFGSAYSVDRNVALSYLGLVEDFLGDFILKDLGGTRSLEDLVLAHREEAFEKVLSDRKANDELLPGKERSVEEMCEALGDVSFAREVEMESYLKEVHIVNLQRSVCDGRPEEMIFPLLA